MDYKKIRKVFAIHNVSCWRSFEEMPKWNAYVDIVWADGTKDKMYWSKPNVENIDFDIDCKPIKWRYACI